jgi:hypothetical protein
MRFMKINYRFLLLLMVAFLEGGATVRAEDRTAEGNIEIKFVVQSAQVEKALKELGPREKPLTSSTRATSHFSSRRAPA